MTKYSSQSPSPLGTDGSARNQTVGNDYRTDSASNIDPGCCIMNHQDLVEEEDDFSAHRCDADILTPFSPSSNSLAVWAQIKTLRTSAGLEATVASPSVLNTSRTIAIMLPEPPQLNRLVGVFFREFECFFPCIYRSNVQKQLRESLRFLGYSLQNRIVHVGVSQFPIMSILCSILACAEAGVHSYTGVEWQPGQTFYSGGAKLVETFANAHKDDVLEVLYHTLSALFLYRSQSLRAALQHILCGYQTANAIGLSDQDKWESRASGLVNHQGLWWTLYYLDKRITQKSGIAYFIREREVVKDFRESSTTSLTIGDLSMLQSLATYSRLWTDIWDNFFSTNAPKAGSWDEIELTDARIMLTVQHTPPHLAWRTHQLQKLIVQGESDVQIRRRLICFLVGLPSPINDLPTFYQTRTDPYLPEIPISKALYSS